MAVVVQRCRRQAQTFAADRHGRVIDRRHIAPVPGQETVADRLAAAGVADQDGKNMTVPRHWREAGGGQGGACRRHPFALTGACDLAGF